MSRPCISDNEDCSTDADISSKSLPGDDSTLDLLSDRSLPLNTTLPNIICMSSDDELIQNAEVNKRSFGEKNKSLQKRQKLSADVM